VSFIVAVHRRRSPSSSFTVVDFLFFRPFAVFFAHGGRFGVVAVRRRFTVAFDVVARSPSPIFLFFARSPSFSPMAVVSTPSFVAVVDAVARRSEGGCDGDEE
jgi:hypothetical protein